MNPTRLLLLCIAMSSLAACDQLGLETPAKTAQMREEEGKAIGGACRHAGRALEDCYQLNLRYAKAAIYTGWRDMDAYMRENKLETVEPEYGEDDSSSRSSRKEKSGAKATEPAAKVAPAKPAAEAEKTEAVTEAPAPAEKAAPEPPAKPAAKKKQS